jgi:hypothetical protein
MRKISSNVSWLIKTGEDKFEIWTDEEYCMKKQKCEYYGAKPYWTEIKQMENSPFQNIYRKLSPFKSDNPIPDLVFR